jgi:hypothetical protein
MGWIVIFVIIFVVLAILVAAGQASNNRSQGVSALCAHKCTLNRQMTCPHCQVKGKILTKQVTMKAGISGGKATGAILTGGLSLLATGLSRKETLTEAYCDNCSSTWHF